MNKILESILIAFLYLGALGTLALVAAFVIGCGWAFAPLLVLVTAWMVVGVLLRIEEIER